MSVLIDILDITALVLLCGAAAVLIAWTIVVAVALFLEACGWLDD